MFIKKETEAEIGQEEIKKITDDALAKYPPQDK